MLSKRARLEDTSPSPVLFTNERMAQVATDPWPERAWLDSIPPQGWVEVPRAETNEDRDQPPEARTPPAPVFREVEWSLREPKWAGDPNIRMGEYTRVDVGTHVWCRYVYKLLHKDSLLPRSAGRPSVVPKLGVLETGRVRPRPKQDKTITDYIERVQDTRTQRRDLAHFVPLTPGRVIYHYNEEWIMYDYERFPECSVCGQALKALNGRAATCVDNFRFKACCYPAPTMYELTPKATTDLHEIVPIYYDLECTPTDEGVHELYLGVSTVPKILRELGQYNDKDHFIFTNASEFIDLVQRTIDAVMAQDQATYQLQHPPQEAEEEETNQPEARKKISIQLVSFNGSRYDDCFLVKAWRNHIYQKWGIGKFQTDVAYSERTGALTFNTLQATSNIEVRWNDLARFVPPTSLKKLAQSFKLDVQKGSMPFEALNDFVRRGPESVVRDIEDGFLDTNHYYAGDHEERARSFEYYKTVVPQESRTPSKDLRVLCEKYCIQDVQVTQLAYECLDRLYKAYLTEEATKSPNSPAGEKFEPMACHSLATMAGKIMLASAVGSKSWGYDSDAQRAFPEGVQPGSTPGFALSAPCGPTYDYVRQSIVGGWTKGYTQSLVVDHEQISAVGSQLEADVKAFLGAYPDFPVLETAHSMTDIASMYPVACTYAMPLGRPEWVEVSTRREELIAQCIAEPDPLRIPKFFVRAKWTAPSKPLFCESTLAQRVERSNSLRWTYWNDLSATRVVTSLDLWIACRDHTGMGPETVWKVHDSIDMLYFARSAQCYRPFMAACTKIKREGAAAGNEEQRTIGKICMNSGIGKLGQQVEAQHNVLGSQAARNLLKAHGDKARLVTVQKVQLEGASKRPYHEDDEYVFGVKDASINHYPTHHAAFMYAGSRLERLNWSLLTRDSHIPIVELDIPDTLYGDTDSKLLEKRRAQLFPKELQGDLVGSFEPEKPSSLLTRPFFQVEPEKVCTAPFVATISGVMTSKKYFVWGTDANTGKYRLKFKCNGLTRYMEGRSCCPMHGIVRCVQCDCIHGDKQFECFHCVMVLLTHEEAGLPEESSSSDDVTRCVVTNTHAGYKYNVRELRSLTLLDFVRVLVTGTSCVVTKPTFLRTLSKPTSKLPAYTIQTSDQSRSLNRPAVLTTQVELARDRVVSKTRMVPCSTGVFAHKPGVLLPSGSYLLTDESAGRLRAQHCANDDDDDESN